jgi:hypothetical protein
MENGDRRQKRAAVASGSKCETGRCHEAFASRDLSEFEVIYLFVDGIAERLHLGQPREAVLAASS